MKGANSFIQKIRVIWLEVSTEELYEGQPQKDEIEKFMYSHNFILLKSVFNESSGEQLYLNKKYFQFFNFLGSKYILKRKKWMHSINF